MDVSIFLAKLFAIYFVVIGIALLTSKEYFKQAAIELVDHKGLSLLTAIITLIMGALLVLFHNIWVADWRVVITILCWLTLVKGVVRVWFPGHMRKMVGVFMKGNVLVTMAVIIVLVGIWLGYVGFIA